jgi:hypothetical protein
MRSDAFSVALGGSLGSGGGGGRERKSSVGGAAAGAPIGGSGGGGGPKHVNSAGGLPKAPLARSASGAGGGGGNARRSALLVFAGCLLGATLVAPLMLVPRGEHAIRFGHTLPGHDVAAGGSGLGRVDGYGAGARRPAGGRAADVRRRRQ